MITQSQSRRLLLGAQGLLAPLDSLEAALQQLGFVQLDSISVSARAHELTLHARLPRYRHEACFALLPQKRAFEHWTHDASLLPAEAWRFWGRRCRSSGERIRLSRWWTERMGAAPEATLEGVRERLAREGPLQSRDFESKRRGAGGWWNWKPEKSALEYLWRTGEVAVVGRRGFQKLYDLAERHLGPPPSVEATELIEWACRGALERLGIATPGELAAYYDLVTPEEARAWSREATGVERMRDVAGRAAVALEDWRERERAYPTPTATRLLAPFDPIVRDRKRALRLFDFDFRFEAFVPAAQRVHGYYTLPILQGTALVGRIGLRWERRAARLAVTSLHWEAGARPAWGRLQQALDRLGRFLGAEADAVKPA